MNHLTHAGYWEKVCINVCVVIVLLQEQLEQSLSQLVVDDDDDDDIDDPAVMTVSKGQPIPGRVSRPLFHSLPPKVIHFIVLRA